MDGDPLLTGTASAFPNQNSSATPTEWVEDLEQAASAGIPCATGPMLHLTQRHTNRPLLPGGEINPCRDAAGTCLAATNVNTDLSSTDLASQAYLARGLIGGSFVAGVNRFPGTGVVGVGRGGNGVTGICVFTTPPNANDAVANGNGVEGRTFSTDPDRAGVLGSGRTGVIGKGQLNGVQGSSEELNGVEGRTSSPDPNTAGVRGLGRAVGVLGNGDTGVIGRGQLNGVQGSSEELNGVQGSSGSQVASGVYGENLSGGGFGVAGRSNAPERNPALPGWGAGVLGDNTAGGWAGFFNGPVYVLGSSFQSGSGFQIDHPVDPANRYLNHSFVESPDMMNVYNGNVTTDADGTATVELPSYFEALNRDFRYQLTVVGEFAQAIVAEEVHGNQFSIKTDKPNVKVSWQVTGIRQDAWASAHPIEPELDKPDGHRGKYLTPAEHGQSPTAAIYVRRPEVAIERDQVQEPPAQDPWASIPATTWPLETAQLPEHLAEVVNPDIPDAE
jgi:hypothetical protein